jgi:hypothetical protein
MRSFAILTTVAVLSCVPPVEHEMPVLSGANGRMEGAPVEPPDPSQCTVAGTFQTRAVDARVAPEGCSTAKVEAEGEGDVVTITVQGDRATVAFNVARGACDGGQLRGCTLTSKCDLEGPGGAATMQLEWKFDQTGFAGSEDLMRFLRQGGECRLMQHVKGTRRL